MTSFSELIPLLVNHDVHFIVVGGAAATAHGSSRLTEDLDIVYQRTPDNIGRLVDTLAKYCPYLRGAPPGLPFRWEVQTILAGLNFTLTTSLGALDLLGEITGGGSYEDLVSDSIPLKLFGVECRCLNLKRLIQVKRAVGRPKDLEVIAELEIISEEQDDDR